MGILDKLYPPDPQDSEKKKKSTFEEFQSLLTLLNLSDQLGLLLGEYRIYDIVNSLAILNSIRTMRWKRRNEVHSLSNIYNLASKSMTFLSFK